MGRIATASAWRCAAIGLAGAGLVLALAPGTALAATLTSNGSTISYNAAAGEANTLTIERIGSDYRFTDAAGITITTPGMTNQCTAAANVGTCPVGTVSQIGASLDDLNDSGTAAASLVEPLNVTLRGGVGDDTLSSTAQVGTGLQGDEFDDPPGNDVLTGGPEGDSLGGRDGNDTMIGNGGDDNFDVEEGNDTMTGGAGDDGFNFGTRGPDGVDLMLGGAGNDRIDARARLDDLHVDLDGAADDGAGCPGAGCEGDNYGADIEAVTTGQGNDVLIGTPRGDDLQSERGNDVIQGLAGNDSLEDFGESADSLEGGPGEDEFFGGDGADAQFGGPGDDLFSFELSDLDTDRYSGGGGFDRIEDAESNIGIRVSLNNRADDGFRGNLFTGRKDNVEASIEDVEGSGGADVLTGSARPNEFRGLAGRDRIVGLAGGDALIGARGRDTLIGGKGTDSLDGGEGPDFLNSRDRRRDELLCGSSLDRVKGDRADRLGPDCDKVSLRGGGQ